MDKESVVLGCGCEVFGDEAEELKQRFRLLRLLIVSTALYAAWLCAMSSGSTAKGALLMLAFALGTVPLMLLFASLGVLLPHGWTKYLRKLGAVLVTSMGLKMLIGGLLLLRG